MTHAPAFLQKTGVSHWGPGSLGEPHEPPRDLPRPRTTSEKLIRLAVKGSPLKQGSTNRAPGGERGGGPEKEPRQAASQPKECE